MFTPVLAHQPDFNTAKPHPPKHHRFNSVVVFYFLLVNLPSHSGPMHHPVIFTLQPPERYPSYFRAFGASLSRSLQLHMKISATSLPKERMVLSQLRVKSGKS